ncbi:hypothetical protein HYX02_05170 [Candidatus Woesearchaeota archaeon]|nr:hypothetical protein [Candidatus Woesearchaeota archaeon]
MEEEFAYKDISELKKEFEGMKGRKEISTTELHDAVQKLAQTMTDMLEVFGAAAEQMQLEEKEHEASARKHEMMLSKLDRIIDQNKTIAEGMVEIVEMVKEKLVPAKEETMFKPREEPFFKPRLEPQLFKPQPEWQPRSEPAQRTQPIMPPYQMPTPQMQQPMMPPPLTTPPSAPDFGMPPMEPTPSPDLDFEGLDLGLEEEPKKKGLFGMFKK